MALLLFLLNGPLVFLSFCLLIVYFRNFIYLSFPAIFILPALQCYSSVTRFGSLYPFCYRRLYCPNLPLLFLPCWEPLDSWALQTWFAALQNVSVLNGYNKILFSLMCFSLGPCGIDCFHPKLVLMRVFFAGSCTFLKAFFSTVTFWQQLLHSHSGHLGGFGEAPPVRG